MTTDYSQYQGWEPVTMPSGAIYYKVPNSGYLYDPFMSEQKGRPVLFVNNQTEYEEKQNAINAQKKREENASNPLYQLAPVAGTVGGLYAANKLAGAGTTAATSTGTTVANTGALGGASGGAGGSGGAALEGAGLVGPTQPGFGAGVMANAGSMGALPVAAIAGSTYLGGEAAYDMLKGRKPGMPGRVILGMATGGLSEVGNALFNRKTTKDIQKENTQSFMDMAPEDAGWQNYVQGARAQNIQGGPPDPSKPFAGKYATWDEYVAGGLEANDLTHVAGNIKSYGKDWGTLSEEDRQAITQRNIDANNYLSSKGEVLTQDEAIAKQIYEDYLKEKQAKELAARSDTRNRR